MDEYEYIDDRPETHFFKKLPDIPETFQNALAKIGGVNPHGQPVLRAVKGNEILSDRAEKQVLKYFIGFSPAEVVGYEYTVDGKQLLSPTIEDVPQNAIAVPRMEQFPLGMLRYVIEKWTSPNELSDTNRFANRYAPGDVEPTLRKFPREGLYETFFIVENAEFKFRTLDSDVLEFIKFKWNFEKKSEQFREDSYYEFRAKEEADKRKVYATRLNAIVDGDLKLPKEETERRREYWKQHDYSEDKQRGYTN